MKILLTADPAIPVPPVGYGGIERIVDALVRAYTAQGHFVGLVAHPASTSPATVRASWPSASKFRSITSLKNTAELLKTVRSFRPDVIHSFSRLGYLLPLLWKGEPTIMSYQRHTGGRQISWASRLGGRNLKFTGCSEFICAMGRPFGGDWTAIPNFIELEKLTFVPRVADDAPLLFLSRLESIKGPDLAIDIARAAGRRLILAGNRPKEGPESEFFDKKIAPRIDGNSVDWIGEVDDVRKNELLGKSAALLVPIQWDEPFGIVFAEALAAGTPVITCARGATPEIIDEGVTGFFIRTVEDGVQAVNRIGQIDREACRRSAEARFTCNSCAARYLKLYDQVIGESQ